MKKIFYMFVVTISLLLILTSNVMAEDVIGDISKEVLDYINRIDGVYEVKPILGFNYDLEDSGKPGYKIIKRGIKNNPDSSYFDEHKLGLMNSQMELIFKPEYNKIMWFDDITAVGERTKDNVKEYVDMTGNVLFTLPLDYHASVSGNNFLVVLPGKPAWDGSWDTVHEYIVLDWNGNKLYSLGEYFSLYQTRDINGNIIYCADKYIGNRKSKEGFIDQFGETIIPFAYDYITYHSDSSSLDTEYFKNGLAIANNNMKYGCINSSGETVIPFNYVDIEMWNGYVIVNLKGTFGVLDNKGNVVIPFEYDMITDNKGHLLLKKNDKYGLTDANGKIVLKAEYDHIDSFENGFARFSLGRKYGFVNEQSEIAIPLEYEYPDDVGLTSSIFSFELEGIALVSKNNKYGFIDKSGKVISEPIWDKADNLFINNYTKIHLGDKVGYMHRNGTIITPKWDWGNNFHEGLALVELEGKTGYIDETGKLVLSTDTITEELIENSINPKGKKRFNTDFWNGYAILKANGKCYFVNKKGEIIFNEGYDILYNFEEEGYAKAYNGPTHYEFTFFWTDTKQANDFMEKWLDKYSGEAIPEINYNSDGGEMYMLDETGNILLSYPRELSFMYSDDPLDFDKDYHIQEIHIRGLGGPATIWVEMIRKTDMEISSNKKQMKIEGTPYDNLTGAEFDLVPIKYTTNHYDITNNQDIILPPYSVILVTTDTLFNLSESKLNKNIYLKGDILAVNNSDKEKVVKKGSIKYGPYLYFKNENEQSEVRLFVRLAILKDNFNEEELSSIRVTNDKVLGDGGWLLPKFFENK
ncbi:WG repeat-containing protein [Brassicibacter mesophilus]|uniref:WG repeat-containing protein n=1 Tax=Brassicibacter mesophilus TaxID=745119 RepID=UPI003D250F7A